MCIIVSIISFLVYFDSKVHKNWKQNLNKKIKSLNFAERNAHRKQMRVAALRHRIIFLA